MGHRLHEIIKSEGTFFTCKVATPKFTEALSETVLCFTHYINKGYWFKDLSLLVLVFLLIYLI